MNILIGLVIAVFIITGAYVGYHASQQPTEVTEGHDVKIELDVLNHMVQQFRFYKYLN